MTNLTDFPIVDQMIFFNHAAVSPLCPSAAQALRDYADHALTRSYVDGGWYEQLNQLRRDTATLINARGPHEIAMIANTSAGLNLVSGGIDWQPGDEVVISNVEYPANRYPWQALERFGVRVVEVAQREDYRIDVHDVIEAITDKTRLVSLSHVQFSTGYRIDLKPIADVVHAAGGWLCVDGIQSLGVLPVDVQAMGIDFLSADGHKWLMGPEGAGVFYCHEELLELLRPAVIGWLNMVNALDFMDYDFTLHRDARRFEAGSWNIPGSLALSASTKMILELGVDQVFAKVDALNQQIRIGLETKGYHIVSPANPDERSGITTFVPRRDDLSVKKIAGDLEKQNVIIAHRVGRLRTSPHFYNTPEQVDQLIEALPVGG